RTNHVFAIGLKPIRKNRGLYRVHVSTKAEEALTSTSDPEERTWEELHRAFGHVHQRALEKLVEENPREFAVLRSPKDYICGACIQGKMHKAPFPRRSLLVHNAIG